MIDRSIRATPLPTGVLILALALPLSAQRATPAQRGGQPRPETPQLVVATLASSDQAVGVAVANAIRKRMQNEHNATDIYLTPGATIEKTLETYGYNPDSALSPSDLLLLAKQVRGDYALSGTVERTASGVRTRLQILTQRGQLVVAEPIAPVLGTDLGDVAKQVDRAVSEALHALSFHRDCMYALAAGDYARAMTAAREGLKVRPNSAAINQCVLSTLRATHGSVDSIIAVATAIAAVDSANTVAWANLADAYTQKDDTARALDAARMLHRLQPTDADITSSLIDRLVSAGQAEPAAALLDTALTAAPDNPVLLRKQWLLQLRLGRYSAAIATGSALVAADSSAATVDFFERQLAAAMAGRDSVAAQRIALEASTHFPKNTSFLLTLARDAIARGSASDALGLLDRVLAIEPKSVLAWQFTIAAHMKSDGADSAIAAGRRALAAGVARDSIGPSLVAVVGPTVAAAQASQKREDWETVLRTAQAVDSIAPTARGSFYVGVAAYQLATSEVEVLSPFATKRAPTRAERQAACESATRAEGYLATTSIALPKGGSADPTTAGKVLGAVPAMSEFVTSVKQAACRTKPDDRGLTGSAKW
jgi:tetratricopeptide (TPR) repeat protein